MEADWVLSILAFMAAYFNDRNSAPPPLPEHICLGFLSGKIRSMTYCQSQRGRLNTLSPGSTYMFLYIIETDPISNSYTVRDYLTGCGLSWPGRSAPAAARVLMRDPMGKNQMWPRLAPKVSRRFPTEYFILANLRVEGGVIGHLADKPIAETVVDGNGFRYHFVGVAPHSADGRFDVDSLRPGEWIVQPGLVYIMEKSENA